MREHVDSREHLTGHVYVDSLGQFKNASFIEKKPKPDNTIKSNNQRLFWPAKADLFEVPTKLVAEVSITDPDYSRFVTLISLMQTDSLTVGYMGQGVVPGHHYGMLAYRTKVSGICRMEAVPDHCKIYQSHTLKHRDSS
ncbi:hypothetical protein E4U09_006442 [Claviceps aff. purpurea]|uniref:Uncharacterized protein n=1 Tax=Claviceps aff. purpurea TaxID=1967640 RepID=A0A9P7U8D7_9HYPO|nr:hypothetical protein E4U09_006442 [Claviceps aff. purpurea]